MQLANNQIPEEALHTLRDVEKRIYRTYFNEFVRKAFEIVSPNDKYVHSWYIDLICEYLMDCYNGKKPKLIINIPPRHMKSIIVNIAFPAWLLGRHPTEQILTTTYSYKLMKDHALGFNRLMNSNWYRSIFPNTIVERESVEYLRTTQGGCRFATTVGGQITGVGGKFIIIDDPLNAQNGNSFVKREKVNEWFDVALPTRKNNEEGAIIIIAQRLHENDLCGHVLKQNNWTLLKLPAIAHEDERYEINDKVYSRKAGELLSTRFSPEFYIEQQKSMGPYHWAGQYQQTPAPLGGGELKKEWLQYYDGVLKYEEYTKIICVDPAHCKKKNSDYTVIMVIGLGPDENIYLLDMVRDKLNLQERIDTLFTLHAKYKPKTVLYERYSMQADIDYAKINMNTKNYRFPIMEVGGILHKEDRIRRIIPRVSNNRVWLPRTLIYTNISGIKHDLIREFVEEEYAVFPVGEHDDMLDCFSRIFDIPLIFPNTKNKVDYSRLTKRVY